MSNSHTVSIHGFVLTSEESRSNVFKWASDIFEHSFSIWATACTTNCFFHGHVCCRPKMPVQMTLNFMCKRGMDESVNGARKIINSEGVSKIVPECNCVKSYLESKTNITNITSEPSGSIFCHLRCRTLWLTCNDLSWSRLFQLWKGTWRY